ncbi:hypothetical protein GQ457_06G023210 [Hibiscus cannabinus]
MNSLNSVVFTNSVTAAWSPPLTGFLKFNVDGAAKESKAGCGGILRNDTGILRALFSGPLEGHGVDFAELMAIRAALELFIEAGWMGKAGLIIESDSRVVLNWIKVPS